jgi:hypothetical protein
LYFFFLVSSKDPDSSGIQGHIIAATSRENELLSVKDDMRTMPLQIRAEGFGRILM